MSRPTVKIDAIGALLALGVLTGIALIAVAPVLAERDRANDRRVELTMIEGETETAMGALRTTARRLADGRTRAESLPVNLRNRAERNTRIAEMVDQAESAGMELLDVVPGDPVSGDRYSRTPVELTMRGDFPSLVRYLHSVHGTSQDLEFTNIEIRRSEGSERVETVIRAEWITLAD